MLSEKIFVLSRQLAINMKNMKYYSKPNSSIYSFINSTNIY